MSYSGSMWLHVPGFAYDIGAGPNGEVVHQGRGHEIFRWHGGVWLDTGVNSWCRAVGPDGSLYDWVMPAGGMAVARRALDRTRTLVVVTPLLPDQFMVSDISVGPDGSIWLIGNCDEGRGPGGSGGIWRYDPRSERWENKHGYGTRIAAGNGVNAWHVGSGGRIYRWNGSAWDQVEGRAWDIGAGPEGDVWHVGNGGALYRLVSGAWRHVSGRATRVAVGPAGIVWHMNDHGALYRLAEPASRNQ